MRRIFALAAVAALVLAMGVVVRGGQASSSTTTTVVPNYLATVNGTSGNAFPFNCGATSTSARYQQVYDRTQVGSGSISQLAFRPYTEAFSPTVIPGVTITLSTTTKPATGLDTTFANNIGLDVATVFSGDLTLSSAGDSAYPVPGAFDIVVPLHHAFTFDSSKGNLLLDVTIPTCKRTGTMGSDGPGTGVARVFTLPTQSSASTSGTSGPDGLITQFTFGSVPTPTCVTGQHGGSFTPGPGTSCLDGATIGGNLTIPSGSDVTVTNSKIGGNVSVASGAKLVMKSSSVGGGVTATSPNGLSLCGATVNGNVSVSGSTGFVLIGDPGDDACPGNSMASLSLQNNTAGVEVSHNPSIRGNVTMTGNSGGSGEDAVPEVEANTINANLSCSANSGVTNDRRPNTVAARRGGQCASL